MQSLWVCRTVALNENKAKGVACRWRTGISHTHTGGLTRESEGAAPGDVNTHADELHVGMEAQHGSLAHVPLGSNCLKLWGINWRKGWRMVKHSAAGGEDKTLTGWLSDLVVKPPLGGQHPQRWWSFSPGFRNSASHRHAGRQQ